MFFPRPDGPLLRLAPGGLGALGLAVPVLLALDPLPTPASDPGTTTMVTVRSDPVVDPGLRPLRLERTPGAFRAERAAFPLEVDGEPVAHGVMAVVALPGEPLLLRAPGSGEHRLVYAAGSAEKLGPGHWRWTPPVEPHIVALAVERVPVGRADGPSGTADGSALSASLPERPGIPDAADRVDRVFLNVLVARPATQIVAESLDGYRIGRYREEPLNGDPAYLPPEAFVRVTPADEDVLVSPHFTLGQFLCKQPGDPRYLALSTPLLRKLEAVLEAANEAGIRTPTFAVMSGFRTPAYNRAIGNTTDYSRHLWGDAADIYVDVDRNGDMDDLNGDGRSDLADARLLAGIVEEVVREGDEDVVPGGLGLYRRNAAHGPFVHVDARGTRARW